MWVADFPGSPTVVTQPRSPEPPRSTRRRPRGMPVELMRAHIQGQYDLPGCSHGQGRWWVYAS